MSSPPQELHFREIGSGAPIVLVHGLAVNGAMFEALSRLLSDAHRVVVPDLQGHGFSSSLPPPYTVAQHAVDLVGLLDRLGIDRAYVLGHSHGAAVAQYAAREYPDRVDRLILVCGYAFNRITLRENVESLMLPVLVHLLGMKRLGLWTARQAGDLTPQQAEALSQMLALGSGRYMCQR